MESRAEFKSRAVAVFNAHVRGRSAKRWVWTWSGTNARGDKRSMKGYFIVTRNGEESLWLADWLEGWPLEVKEISPSGWKLLAQQDQSAIKGGRGNIPAPTSRTKESESNGC